MCKICSFVFLDSSPPIFKIRVSAEYRVVCPKHLDCFREILYLLKLVVLPTRRYYLTIVSL